jgi:hypothetical protein
VNGETVWLLPRTDGPVDEFNDSVPTWPDSPNHPDAVPIGNVTVWQRSDLAGEAAIAGREAVITDVKVLIHGDQHPQPGPLDRMWVRGRIYDVIGEPHPWRARWHARSRGTELSLRRTAG